MKGKILLSFAIVLSMMLAALPLVPVKAIDPVTVEVRFENSLNEITKAPCNDFVATIYLTLPEGVTIDFWDMEIHWDTTVLELQTGTSGDVLEGSFMSTSGSTVFICKEPDNVAGILSDISCGYLAGGPASGEGDLCSIGFHAKAPGDGGITIYLPNEESFLLMGASLVKAATTRFQLDTNAQ
jgi:hypothetical protein